jgi:hypothetical protein
LSPPPPRKPKESLGCDFSRDQHMTAPFRDRAPLLLGIAACAAALSLYGYALVRPQLLQDDFQILAQSVTWQQTRDGLWVPNNEHAMPLSRLLTFAVIQLAGRATNYPQAASLVGPTALLAALGLTFCFVQREMGHVFYSLMAITLFGVTAVYQQAVYWFAASFSVLALDLLLLGLLAAQSFRRTRRWPYLLLSALWCGLAPCWFASGVLAGPLCALYLLCPSEPRPSGSGDRIRNLCYAALPLTGTVAFLAVSIPRTADHILHLEHYRNLNTDAVFAFQPDKGLLMSLRSIVENLLLGVVGVTAVQVPIPLVILVWVGLWNLGRWWWLQTPCKRLLVLGLGLIGTSYLLVYSARAKWAEDLSLTGPTWSRYHLLPQLGWTLFLVGGLPAWNGRRFSLRDDGHLTPKQVKFLAYLIGLLWLINMPRGVICSMVYDADAQKVLDPADQRAALHRVEMVNARCREQEVSAAAARRALPPLTIPCAPGFNGWDLLKGSATPRFPETRSNEEIRQLLE